MSNSLPLQEAPCTATAPVRSGEIETLHTAQAMYALLSQLQVGDRVPERCYILDYRDGTIPPWQVCHREESGSLCVLVLIDLNTTRSATSSEPQQWVARRVLAHPHKILASPLYLVGTPGAGPRPMLCDLMQQVRALKAPPLPGRKEHH